MTARRSDGEGSGPVIARGLRIFLTATGAFFSFGLLFFAGALEFIDAALIATSVISTFLVAWISDRELQTSKNARLTASGACLLGIASEVLRAAYYYSAGLLGEFSWSFSVLLCLGLAAALNELRTWKASA
jgi:hypothetical protein